MANFGLVWPSKPYFVSLGLPGLVCMRWSGKSVAFSCLILDKLGFVLTRAMLIFDLKGIELVF